MPLAAFGGHGPKDPKDPKVESPMSEKPSKPPKKKPEMLRVRVTREELDAYDAAATACEMDRSKWVRQVLHPERSKPRAGALRDTRESIAALVKLRFQVKQAGGNLNQLVRLVHEKKLHTTQGSEELLRELLGLYEEAIERLDELRVLFADQLRERSP